MDDDAELRDVFRDEARRRVREMAKAVRGQSGRERIWRHAHSLKGAAGSVGEGAVERLAQDIAEAVRDEQGRPLPWTDEARERVVRDVEKIEDELRRLG